MLRPTLRRVQGSDQLTAHRWHVERYVFLSLAYRYPPFSGCDFSNQSIINAATIVQGLITENMAVNVGNAETDN